MRWVASERRVRDTVAVPQARSVVVDGVAPALFAPGAHALYFPIKNQGQALTGPISRIPSRYNASLHTGDGVGDGLGDALGVGDGDGVVVGDGEGDAVAVGVAVPVGDVVGVGVGDGATPSANADTLLMSRTNPYPPCTTSMVMLVAPSTPATV